MKKPLEYYSPELLEICGDVLLIDTEELEELSEYERIVLHKEAFYQRSACICGLHDPGNYLLLNAEYHYNDDTKKFTWLDTSFSRMLYHFRTWLRLVGATENTLGYATVFDITRKTLIARLHMTDDDSIQFYFSDDRQTWMLPEIIQDHNSYEIPETFLGSDALKVINRGRIVQFILKTCLNNREFVPNPLSDETISIAYTECANGFSYCFEDIEDHNLLYDQYWLYTPNRLGINQMSRNEMNNLKYDEAGYYINSFAPYLHFHFEDAKAHVNCNGIEYLYDIAIDENDDLHLRNKTLIHK